MIKSLEARLEETTNMLETVLEETTLETTALKAQLKTKTDLLEAVQSKTTSSVQKETARKNNEVEVSLEKCKVCGFSSKSKVVMHQHMESRHKGVKVFKCLMCAAVLNSKESFKQHKVKHQKELDVVTFEHVCKECNISFGCREDQLQHLLDKHRPKNYKKHNSGHDMNIEECRNGPSCKWLKEGHCNFEHKEQPWKKVQHRRQRQATLQQSQKQQPRQQQQGKQHDRQQQQIRQTYPRQEQKKPACSNGPACKFLKENRCNFYHKQARHQMQHQRQSSGAWQQNAGSIQLRQCKFGSRCDKGRECGFLHLPTDFLQPHSGRRN